LERTLVVLKIQRSTDGENVRLALSGRIEKQHLAELQRLIDEVATRHVIMLDLEEVRLVDREAVGFLAHCEATGFRLENCPAYVREWIVREGTPPGNPPRTTRR
jgi:ABC-type transporter Mla MlaB component